MMALVASVVAEHRESTYERGLVSGRIEAERCHDDTVAACSTLHYKIAVPVIGHCKREADTELLGVHSRPAIHHSLNAAVSGQWRCATLSPRYFFSGSGRNRGGFCDLKVWGFEF